MKLPIKPKILFGQELFWRLTDGLQPAKKVLDVFTENVPPHVPQAVPDNYREFRSRKRHAVVRVVVVEVDVVVVLAHLAERGLLPQEAGEHHEIPCSPLGVASGQPFLEKEEYEALEVDDGVFLFVSEVLGQGPLEEGRRVPVVVVDLAQNPAPGDASGNVELLRRACRAIQPNVPYAGAFLRWRPRDVVIDDDQLLFGVRLAEEILQGLVEEGLPSGHGRHDAGDKRLHAV